MTKSPRVYKVGSNVTIEGKKHHVMIMDLLGENLEQKFQSMKRKFDLATCLHIAVQMVHRIKDVHDMRIIHRDIKPENLLINPK